MHTDVWLSLGIEDRRRAWQKMRIFSFCPSVGGIEVCVCRPYIYVTSPYTMEPHHNCHMTLVISKIFRMKCYAFSVIVVCFVAPRASGGSGTYLLIRAIPYDLSFAFSRPPSSRILLTRYCALPTAAEVWLVSLLAVYSTIIGPSTPQMTTFLPRHFCRAGPREDR